MSFLIDDLKEEHAVLVEEISQVKRMGISTSESRQKLLSIKETLIAHLKKEDQKLYPKLREVAAHDEGVKKILETFAKDMEQITQVAMEFFDRYSHESDDIAFYKDIGRLFAALADRIRKEEGTLYRIYDKHFPD